MLFTAKAKGVGAAKTAHCVFEGKSQRSPRSFEKLAYTEPGNPGREAAASKQRGSPLNLARQRFRQAGSILISLRSVCLAHRPHHAVSTV